MNWSVGGSVWDDVFSYIAVAGVLVWVVFDVGGWLRHRRARKKIARSFDEFVKERFPQYLPPERTRIDWRNAPKPPKGRGGGSHPARWESPCQCFFCDSDAHDTTDHRSAQYMLSQMAVKEAIWETQNALREGQSALISIRKQLDERAMPEQQPPLKVPGADLPRVGDLTDTTQDAKRVRLTRED